MREKLRRALRRPAPLVDPALVVLVLGLSAYPLLRDGATGWGYVLVAAQAAPLLGRRRAPFPIAGVCGLLTVVYGVSQLPDPPVPYSALVAVYSAASFGTQRQAVLTGAFTFAGLSLSLLVDASANFEDAALNYPIFATAWLLGDGARRRRRLARELAARADHAERTRAAEAAAAVAAERARIARDMHDVVAHHLSMIVVQAEAGPLAAGPDQAAEAFDAISAGGKQALAEMRLLLGVLMDDDPPPLHPQPGLGDLDELVAGVRAAGLDVRLHRDGDPPAVAQPVAVAVYRLVQEALTNCLRHSSASQAEVVLHHDRSGGLLCVTVTDDGAVEGAAPSSPLQSGHGLVAMRERVTLAGGGLEAGPAPGGGWAVHARLPVGPR